MGQYFYLVNTDKKQFIHPHQIGNGLKIGEQRGWKYSTEVVAGLLAGEASDKHQLIGSWRGDHVCFVGDYGGVEPVAGFERPCDMGDGGVIYEDCQDCDETPGEWTNIAASVREMMTALYGIRYEDEGWFKIFEPGATAHVRPAMTPDMIFSVK